MGVSDLQQRLDELRAYALMRGHVLHGDGKFEFEELPFGGVRVSFVASEASMKAHDFAGFVLGSERTDDER